MKYKVEVGGFVSTFRKGADAFVSEFRQRRLVIYAETAQEAKEKAIDKFVDLSQQRVGNMCEICDCQVDSIEIVLRQ